MTKLHYWEFIAAIIICQLLAVSTIVCPHYCRCYMNNGLRFVTCVNRLLVSMNLDIPRTAQWLQLSNNSIFELKDYTFQGYGLEHIVILEMDHNHIESVGLDAFAGLNKLEVVDLRYNHLYHIIPYTFEMNEGLKQLYLGGNPLTYMPQSEPFLFSESLEVLDVSSCRLNFITPALILGLPSLKTLNVSRNNIQQIDGLIDFMNNVKVLDISKTEIKCNEHAARLSSWGSNHSANIVGYPCLSSRQVMSVEKSPELIDEEPPSQPNWINHSRLGDSEESSEMDEEGKDEDDTEKSTVTAPDVVITEAQRRRNNNNNTDDDDGSFNWVVWLAFINGFASGAAVAGSTVICWIYCTRRRKSLMSLRRRQVMATRFCNSVIVTAAAAPNDGHVETTGLVDDNPPPSYYELFRNA